MNFRVRFTATPYCAFQKDLGKVGLDLVDTVREELELPELPLEVFSENVQRYFYNPELELTEEQARKSGHFKDKNYIEVHVPEGFLNRYIYIDYKVSREPDGKITNVKFFFNYNSEQIIEDWLEDGSPLKWNEETGE